MHRALEAHVACLSLNTRLFLNCLDDLTEEAAQWRKNGGGNNVNFIALHLVDARFYLARTLGAEIPNPFSEDLERANSIDDIEQFPSMDEIRATWIDVSRQLLQRMVALPEDVLWGDSEQESPVEDNTKLGGVAFLLHHESYHIGQMGLLRRQLGYPSMSYAARADSGGTAGKSHIPER